MHARPAVAAVRREAPRIPEPLRAPRGVPEPVGHAYTLLRFSLAAAAIVAGLDKFAGLLVDWERYLAPIFPQLLGIPSALFVRGVGVVEIAAGLLVALAPRVGAYVLALWLWAIVADLLVLGRYLDVALRDLGLSLGALALGRLAQGMWEARRAW